jgi:tRNA(Arg) A34 adenosine deaminase TadA
MSCEHVPISDVIHEEFMRETLELAREARRADKRPFVALLAVDGWTVATGHNTADSEGNPPAHAELNLLENAINHFDPETTTASTLYTNAEPYPMCAAAAYYASVRSLVYSVPATHLTTLLDAALGISCRDVLASVPIVVVGPVFEEPGHRDYPRERLRCRRLTVPLYRPLFPVSTQILLLIGLDWRESTLRSFCHESIWHNPPQWSQPYLQMLWSCYNRV